MRTIPTFAPTTVLVIAACFLAGCSFLGPQDEAGLFEIHLAERFSGEIVTVQLDGRTVFTGPATSSRSGLAEIISVGPSKGLHQLRVYVGAEAEAGTRFRVGDTLFVQIRYSMDFQREVRFTISETRPTYL